MEFHLEYNDPGSSARAGIIHTDHGKIPTPVFMPVGTTGNVKAVHVRDLRDDVKAGIMLSNTYHLYLRPGIDVLSEAGGLHRFAGWDLPILTDSGGYQVYSLASNRKITSHGVVFSSHIDGSKHEFTPERAVDIQRVIGSDIIMALDECTPYPCDRRYASKSLDITHAWLERCAGRMERTTGFYGHTQALFPIVQGSVYEDLREKSAGFVAGFDAPGNAIGGLSVGEPDEIMYRITSQVCSILPSARPRYLMGVGTPENILECISLGVDMFDCVIPSRNARHALLYTSGGILNMRNEKWKNDFSCLDQQGSSFVDQTCTKAYLRYLFTAGESLAGMIATLHNLAFYQWLVREARARIAGGDFTAWKNGIVNKLRTRL